MIHEHTQPRTAFSGTKKCQVVALGTGWAELAGRLRNAMILGRGNFPNVLPQTCHGKGQTKIGILRMIYADLFNIL